MTGAREMFSELSQAEIDVEVVLGDDIVVRAVGHGTITFQRIHESHDFERCTVCTWAKKELGFSFHD